MTMGRPRKKRKDLPPGLYWSERRGFYYYRVLRGETTYAGIGKVNREKAIKAWVKITNRAELETTAAPSASSSTCSCVSSCHGSKQKRPGMSTNGNARSCDNAGAPSLTGSRILIVSPDADCAVRSFTATCATANCGVARSYRLTTTYG
jgi:hypothetical protein